MNAIEIQGLTKRYGPITAVDGLDLEITLDYDLQVRAEEILAQKNLDQRDYELAQARLKRALVRTSIH